jgi:hypothetical protein
MYINPTLHIHPTLDSAKEFIDMLKRLWRRIVERNRRINSELEQIELELAKEDSRFPLLPPFPQKPYKASTITLFCVFGFFVSFAALVCLKELIISFFP